ncbi:hypothetical protein [Streptomyces atacamensis]|uniref:hypothetical protein n=1 Tax=Streptomyces atacamensis TaxID=531966 RepID=UPI00399D15D2
MTLSDLFTIVLEDPDGSSSDDGAARPAAPGGGWPLLPPRSADDLVSVVAALNAPGKPPFFVDHTAG